MGHRANFVVIESGAARAYQDNWAGLGAAFAIADGPGAAVESLREFESTDELMDWALAEGGFLIDFDQSLVIVFGELEDQGEAFSDHEDYDGGGEDDDEDDEEPSDDGDDEADSYVERYTDYFNDIAGNWHGWQLRYDNRGVDAFAEHLSLRGISSIEVQEPSHPEATEQFALEV